MNVLHIQMMYFLYYFIYFLLHSMLGKNCTVQIFAVKYRNVHSLYIYIRKLQNSLNSVFRMIKKYWLNLNLNKILHCESSSSCFLLYCFVIVSQNYCLICLNSVNRSDFHHFDLFREFYELSLLEKLNFLLVKLFRVYGKAERSQCKQPHPTWTRAQVAKIKLLSAEIWNNKKL